MFQPRLVDGSDPDLPLVHALMKAEFAYMDGVVDPPSSIDRLTVSDLRSGDGEVWAIDSPPIACVILTPRADSLYIGKLAVGSTDRGKGLSRVLIDHAESRARELGLTSIECETRVELVANQRTFEAMGFIETERTAHAGYSRPTGITYTRSVV